MLPPTEPGVGNELMCSAIVAGPPAAALDALAHPCSASSLLGPRARATVLESGGGWQLVRLDLAPDPGAPLWAAAAAACAPRVAVVRVTRRVAPGGVHLLLFQSVPRREAARRLRAAAAAARDGGGGSNSGGGGGWWSWSWAPVLMDVAGGYSAAQLSPPGGLNDDGSSGGCESLLTGVVRADPGGWLAGAWQPAGDGGGGGCSSSDDSGGTGGPLRRCAAALAAALLDSAALAVPTAKQEVESGRALAYPPAGARRPGPPRSPSPSLVAAAAAAASDLAGRLRRVSSAAAGEVASTLSGGLSGGLVRRLSSLGFAGRRSSADLLGRRLPGASSDAGGGGGGLSGNADPATWCGLHRAGAAAGSPDAPFRVRGARYLDDRRKVAAGAAEFPLRAVELVTTPAPLQHVSR